MPGVRPIKILAKFVLSEQAPIHEILQIFFYGLPVTTNQACQ
jgi:hypothetical protein